MQHLLLELRLYRCLETEARLAAIAAVIISLIMEHKGSDKHKHRPMAAFLGVRPSNGEVLVELMSHHFATEKEVQRLLEQVFVDKTPIAANTSRISR